ncbi:MAG: hypothetical protein ACLP59_00095, partial [Bryobacteraceae bacterium]
TAAMRHRRRDWTTALVSWQVGTSSVWFYLSKGCRTRNPAALTAGFHPLPAFDKIQRFAGVLMIGQMIAPSAR